MVTNELTTSQHYGDVEITTLVNVKSTCTNVTSGEVIEENSRDIDTSIDDSWTCGPVFEEMTQRSNDETVDEFDESQIDGFNSTSKTYTREIVSKTESALLTMQTPSTEVQPPLLFPSSMSQHLSADATNRSDDDSEREQCFDGEYSDNCTDSSLLDQYENEDNLTDVDPPKSYTLPKDTASASSTSAMASDKNSDWTIKYYNSDDNLSSTSSTTLHSSPVTDDPSKQVEITHHISKSSSNSRHSIFIHVVSILIMHFCS